VKRTATVAISVLALAACGGSDANAPVAHVGGETITNGELQQAVDHFKQEADAEGRSFPEQGSAAFRTVQREALGLLVYRAELVQSAEKLGVPVGEAEVTARMTSSNGENEGSEAFARDTVRAQLAYEHVYSKVTADVEPERRDAAMRKWLRQMPLRYEVGYEEGFEPSS